MTYDTKIRAGSVINGLDEAPVTADIGIKDGKIVEIGKLSGHAKRVIDADGALVTPGVIDVHTHYDGQISWDPELKPSSIHGVTTAILGSCGVGFAPVRPEDRERLVRLMEGVEDIPGTALSEGINWQWESFPEYMSALEHMPHAIDYGVHVPHDPLRVYVMGDRAVANQAATSTDIKEMAALLKDALDAGAMGLTTGRSDNHRSADGEETPAAEASRAEMLGLANAFAGRDKGVIQVVSDFDILRPESKLSEEWALIEAMAETSGRPLSVSLMQRDQDPSQWTKIIELAEHAVDERGLDIKLQVAPRGIGVLLGLNATFHPFIGFPSYQKIAHLPLEERVRQLKDPAFRAQLLTEKNAPLAGEGSSVPPLADWLLSQLESLSMRIFSLGEVPNYEPNPKDSLGAQAKAAGRPVLEAMLDALLENQGNALLYFPVYNYTDMSLDAVHTMLTHRLSLPALSDGGAHVGTICDASFPTYFLQYWGRDRERGKIPVEHIVHRQTKRIADYLGLTDRGTLEVGMRADMNIIDFTSLGLKPPHLVQDLPAGGRRLLQEASGYVATLVSGEAVAEGGELTGARPGTLVRH